MEVCNLCRRRVMLNLLGGLNGRQDPDWAPMSRRSFLKIGGMAAGGLSLSSLLSLEAKAKTGSSHKSVINIFMPGGPSHIDSFDLKPNAPIEIRGEFKPISTNVPGIQICELFPKMRSEEHTSELQSQSNLVC